MSVHTPLFDIHSQLTPWKTFHVSRFDMQPTNAAENGLCAKHNLHTGNNIKRCHSKSAYFKSFFYQQVNEFTSHVRYVDIAKIKIEIK